MYAETWSSSLADNDVQPAVWKKKGRWMHVNTEKQSWNSSEKDFLIFFSPVPPGVFPSSPTRHTDTHTPGTPPPRCTENYCLIRNLWTLAQIWITMLRSPFLKLSHQLIRLSVCMLNVQILHSRDCSFIDWYMLKRLLCQPGWTDLLAAAQVCPLLKKAINNISTIYSWVGEND